jgi:hypothetical protein
VQGGRAGAGGGRFPTLGPIEARRRFPAVVCPIKSGAAGSHLGGAAMLPIFTQRKSPRSSAGGPLMPDELLMIDAGPSVRVGPVTDETARTKDVAG